MAQDVAAITGAPACCPFQANQLPNADARTAVRAKTTPSPGLRPAPAAVICPNDSTPTPMTPRTAPIQAAGAAFCPPIRRNRIRLTKARAAKITATTADATCPSAA